MPAPTVTVYAPPPTTYHDPGIVRPQAIIAWTGGTGPFDVLHEWDTVQTFDSGNLIQVDNPGVTSPNEAVPTADLGGVGTAWYYRATVTDTSDAAFTISNVLELEWLDPVTHRRYLYLLAGVGVGYAFDEPAGGWGDAGTPHPDGDNTAFNRYLYLLANIGVGFHPIDTPEDGWGPGGADAGDGYAIAFNRYHYLLGDVTDEVPTPHIWFVFPDFGREGWEFTVIGYGFGDTQATYNGNVLLNALGCSILDWDLMAAVGTDRIINPDTNTATPIHQRIRAVVPAGAESGLIFVTTDA